MANRPQVIPSSKQFWSIFWFNSQVSVGEPAARLFLFKRCTQPSISLYRLRCLHLWGSKPRQHDYSAFKRPTPMTSNCNHCEGKKSPRPIFDWSANKNYDLVFAQHVGGISFTPVFINWWANQLYSIISSWPCVTYLAEKPSSNNHSNPWWTLTFQINLFCAPKIKIKTMNFSQLLCFNNLYFDLPEPLPSVLVMQTFTVQPFNNSYDGFSFYATLSKVV